MTQTDMNGNTQEPVTLENKMDAFYRQFTLAEDELRPVYVSGFVGPVEGADIGINRSLLDPAIQKQTLKVIVPFNPALKPLTLISLYWGAKGKTPILAGSSFANSKSYTTILVAANKAVEGFGELYYTIKSKAAPSHKLTTFYKRTLPGGPDRRPNEPWHSELSKPKNVPAILQGQSLPKVLDLEIAPYPNMRVNDLIILSWGQCTISRKVNASEVGNPVVIQVDDATVRSAGSGKIEVVYQIVDEVQNLSEKYSDKAIVEVDLSTADSEDNLRDPAYVTLDDETPVDRVELEALEGDDILVHVWASRPGFKPDDTLQVNWAWSDTLGNSGLIQPTAQVIDKLAFEYTFKVPYDQAAAIGGARANITYVLLRKGAEVARSLPTTLDVIGIPVYLAAPTVVEGPLGVLDPSLREIQICVPRYSNAAIGDLVTFYLDGQFEDGNPFAWESTLSVSRSILKGTDDDAFITYSVDIPDLAGELDVCYDVRKKGVPALLDSDILTLLVSDAREELPAPSVPLANNNVLDSKKIRTSVAVQIAPYPDMSVDDIVVVQFRGQSATSQFSDTVSVNDPKKPLNVLIPANIIGASKGEDVEIRYRVESKEGKKRWSAIYHLQVDVLPPTSLPAPAVEAAVDGKFDPLLAQSGMTVKISYPGMSVLDTLQVNIDGKALDPSITGSDAGAVYFSVPKANVLAAINRSIAISYDWMRGEQVVRSAALSLQIQKIDSAFLPTPQLIEAKDSNVLDLDTVRDNATVVVKRWPFIAAGQIVSLTATATTPDGQKQSAVLLDQRALTAEQAAQGLQEPLPRNFLSSLPGNSRLIINCTVTWLENQAAEQAQEFPALLLTIKKIFIESTNLAEQDLNGWISPVLGPQNLSIVKADDGIMVLRNKSNVAGYFNPTEYAGFLTLEKQQQLKKGASYQLSVSIRRFSNSGSTLLKLGVENGGIGLGSPRTPIANSTWQQISLNFVAPSDSVRIWMFCYLGGGMSATNYEIQSLTLREIT
ncbi:hypothetical protein FHW69_000151 [Luteibacter sp. Sphag1AF]|uniref:hypothetical protein n=1 Tax=Luteibacter sp. Sphag1AF TaxID=2587031 RepID=UPI0016138663|nr:hypothetical protein [Luteibacter sp. Sphag1AF]MBB3225561.1 hypothetical protein [Luteibacter sp. Sphag1AF]